MKTYQEAVTVLNGRKSRKVENNTYLHQLEDGSIGVKLHETDVVIYRQDGTIQLNTGGWETVTTKARLNDYSPVGIYQKKRVWFVTRFENGQHVELGKFTNGMVVTSNGEVLQ
jgi:hypothetical protein